MAFSALGMGFLFTAKDLATAKIRHLQTNVGKLAKESEAASIKYERSMKRIKSGAMMVGGGVVGLLAINKASKAFETFEKNLVSAGSIMGATAEEMKALKEAGIQAGIATQFSPAEAVQGLENLGAAGMNAQQSISTLNSVLGLASASLGQLGVADSASVVVGVLNAFGETTDMAAKRVDQLVQVTKKSNFQARDFSIALSQASAQAKAADQSFESMLATLGLLRNTNLDASSSATAYREAVRRLSGDKLAQKKLSELNVDTLDKETGKIKDLAKIVLELQPKIAKLNAKERNLALTKMFGVRGMKTYNAIMAGYHKLVKEGKVQVGDYAGAHTLLMKSLEDSEGAMAKSRDAYLQTAAGQRVLLKGSWETFQVIAGETFTPVLLPALQGTISMLNKLIAIVKDIPAPIKTMVAQFAGFSSVALLAVGSMRLLSGAMGLFSMSGAAGRWLETQSKLGEGMDAAGKKSKKLAGSTGRLAKVNATLSRGLSGLGRALPFIGIAAAGIASIYNMIKADEKAVEEYRQKRAEFEKKLAMQTASDYGRIEAAAQRTKAAALEASEALVRKTQAHKGLARVNLVKLEKEVLKAVMKRKSLMNELASVETQLENRKLTMAKRAERTKEAMRIRGELRKAEVTIQANKWAAARVRGLDSENQLRYTKDAEKRRQLTGRAVAGRVAQERYLSRLILMEEKKKETAEKAGLSRAAQAHGANIKKLRKQRETERLAAARLAGAGGVRDPRARRRMVMRAAKTDLESVSRFGTEAQRSRIMQAVTTGNIPEGMSQSELERVREMTSGRAGQDVFMERGGLPSQRAFLERLANIMETRQRDPGAIGAGNEIARSITVQLNMDGEKIAKKVVLYGRDTSNDTGTVAGAGEFYAEGVG